MVEFLADCLCGGGLSFVYLQVDLDLGNYERFLDIKLTRDNNITTGKIFQVKGLTFVFCHLTWVTFCLGFFFDHA